jgi:hypothetical protein
MGITAYEDTFKSKNTYENILTGINKEGSRKLHVMEISCQGIACFHPVMCKRDQ